MLWFWLAHACDSSYQIESFQDALNKGSRIYNCDYKWQEKDVPQKRDQYSPTLYST